MHKQAESEGFAMRKYLLTGEGECGRIAVIVKTLLGEIWYEKGSKNPGTYGDKCGAGGFNSGALRYFCKGFGLFRNFVRRNSS